MLQPKRTKFRKMHKGRNRGLAQGTDVSFGSFGLKAVGRGRLTAKDFIFSMMFCNANCSITALKHTQDRKSVV